MTEDEFVEQERLLDEQAAQTRQQEDQAAAAVTAAVAAPLAGLAAALTAQWVLLTGGDLDATATPAQAATIARQAAQHLGAVHDAAQAALPGLLAAARGALALGVRHGREQAAGTAPVAVPGVPRDVEHVLRSLPDHVAREGSGVVVRARTARTLPDLLAAADTSRRATSAADATARWAINRAEAHGVTAVADATGRLKVWRAERDGCLTCLAYAGRVDRGDGFPEDLTFGDRPILLGPVKYPPKHPHCRCQLALWSGREGTGPGLPYPQALAREARRSVLKGFALPGESVQARRRAAERVLARPTGLPPSVVAAARERLDSGRFDTKPSPV